MCSRRHQTSQLCGFEVARIARSAVLVGESAAAMYAGHRIGEQPRYKRLARRSHAWAAGVSACRASPATPSAALMVRFAQVAADEGE